MGIRSDIPLFVLHVDAQRHQVVVGPADELLVDSLWASDVNYLAGVPPGSPDNADNAIEVTAKIRYKASEVPATLYPRGDHAVVRLHTPQRAVTPGQAVVFYQGDRLLGGGIIEGTGEPAIATV